MERCLLTLAVVVGGGCWSEEPLIHDTFTPDQWAHLQQDFAPLQAPAPCEGLASTATCEYVTGLGQQLFFEPALSGPADKLRVPIEGGKTSCATCHDPKRWFIDSRPDSAVSQGAITKTKHNTISLVNVFVGYRELYTWSGQCTKQPCQTPQNVVHDIALPKAMASDAGIVARLIRTNPSYALSYSLAFGANAAATNAEIQKNVELALDAYMRRLNSLQAPFDAFIAGDDTAISDSAKKGFALFVGKAMCIECHNGWSFSDGIGHVTGVVDTSGDKGHADSGAFYTPTLRHVAETAPYMHNGSVKTLGDVLELYRWGGAATDFVGVKDPLMAPFDMTDEDAADLVAFMKTLTGTKVADALMRDTHVVGPQPDDPTPDLTCQVPNSANQGLVCDGTLCADVANDPRNCGSCGHDCGMGYCMGGMCGP